MEETRTVRQWSLRSGIPYRTLLEAVKSGDLPAMQFTSRGQIFVHPDDFHLWIEKAKRRPIRIDEEDGTPEEDDGPDHMDIPSAD